MSDGYRIRPYRSSDEPFVVFSWLSSHAKSEHGKRWNTKTFARAGDEDHYWTHHRPVVNRLLGEAEVLVACDEADDDIIWGWSCTSGADVLHYAVVKFVLAGDLAMDVVRKLLPGRLDRAQIVTHEQCGLRQAKVRPPTSWRYDPYWIASRWSK